MSNREITANGNPVPPSEQLRQQYLQPSNQSALGSVDAWVEEQLREKIDE